MADPVVTDWWKAQWIWKGRSALPEDVYVNTWVFQRESSTVPPTMQEDVEAILRAFYLETDPTTARSVVSFLSPIISADAELRIYDLGQLPPREPTVVPIPTLPARGASGLPSEVAATMSFYAGRNLPRRRGRIFLGPLSTGAGDVESNTFRVKIAPVFMETVLNRAQNVMQSSRGARWGVFSRADANCFQTTNVWVDDAFDTQRRRGEAAAERRERVRT